MITAAYHRDTLVELHNVHTEANGIRVVCSIRAQAPEVIADPTSPRGVRLQAKRVPELLLEYKDGWTQEEVDLEIAYRTMVERKVAARVLAYQESPERQAEKVTEALAAEKRAEDAQRAIDEAIVERKRIEIEAQARLDELEAELAARAKQRNDAIEAELAARQKQLAELDAQLAEKRSPARA